MRDLTQIQLQNAIASKGDIRVQRENGKFVIKHEDGMHYIAHHVFDSEAEALASEVYTRVREVGNHLTILAPFRARELEPA